MNTNTYEQIQQVQKLQHLVTSISLFEQQGSFTEEEILIMIRLLNTLLKQIREMRQEL